MTEAQILFVAEETHEINRSYCELIGDKSQLPWKDSPEWQRASALEGVKFILSNSSLRPEDSHNSWLKKKRDDGWVYGQTKNEEKKTHPNMCAFYDLPQEQQVKDYIFVSVVRAMSRLMS